jgi:hypothetical protein
LEPPANWGRFKADDLWARLEVAERAVFCHPQRLSALPARLNQFSSDSA